MKRKYLEQDGTCAFLEENTTHPWSSGIKTIKVGEVGIAGREKLVKALGQYEKILEDILNRRSSPSEPYGEYPGFEEETRLARQVYLSTIKRKDEIGTPALLPDLT